MSKDNNSFGHDGLTDATFHTVKETAEYLRLCDKQVRRLISRGKLPAYQFGTALRIKKEDIDTYIKAHQIGRAHQNTICK